MAGLLDFNNPELMQGLMMLTAKKGQTPGLLQNFLQMQEQRKQRALQEEMQKQQMEARQMQMDQQRQQQAERDQIRTLGAKAFAPNQNLVQNDDMGNPMPSSGGGGMQEFSQGLMGINPMLGAQFMPKPQQPKMAFAPNGQAVDMNALQPGTNYAPPPKMPDWKDPEYQAFQLKRAQAGASRMTVDNRQENEFNRKIGGQFAENYNDILKGGMAAQGKYRDLQRFESIVDKVPTGKLEPLKAEVGRLGASLGIKVDTEKLGFQDALESLSNQFALQMRNPQGGAGMPGAMSDKDREFLVSIVPGLGKTPGGNKLILEAFKRVAKREMEIAKLARAYKQQTGKFDEGFYEVLAQEFGTKDMLGDLAQTASQRGAVSVGGVTLRFDAQGNPI